MAPEAHNVVAGELRDGSPYDVINPAHFSEVVGVGHAASPELVDEAARTAAAAAPGWARLPFDARVDALRQAMKEVTAAGLDELAVLLTREQGKVLSESRFEVGRAPALVDLFSALVEEATGTQELDDERGTRRNSHVPVGPVAAITPWNWPVSLSMGKVVPALLAGNPLILKPAPNTPLTISAIGAAIARSLPPGVLSVLHGGADVGAALTAHPLIRKVVFTGSIPSGRKVYAGAGATIRNLTLELGGNDAAVLLDDVDLTPEVTDRLLASTLVTSGQVCWAIKRIYAPRSRYGEVIEALNAAVDRYIVGPGLEPEVTLGPLNNALQLGIVTDLVDRAAADGARVHELGTYLAGLDPAEGFFRRPVVVSDVDNSAAIVQEEQFGPAIPVVAYDEESRAVEWANGTEFGLCASVWTNDDDRGFQFAHDLEAGQIFVNCHAGAALDYTCGFGGIKQSGLGREMGVAGIREYLEPRLISNRMLR